jgi:hypothetical protein
MRLLVVGLSVATGALAQSSALTPDLNLIVTRMEQREHAQQKAIAQYRSRRHYTVEYRGFPKNLSASMEVEASYAAGFGKSFLIVSQAGSQMLCERVLNYALDSERKASLDSAANALNRKNYRFRFAGEETDGDQQRYLLDVEPVTPNWFSYRGRIWVDAASYAVVEMDVEPAKNPSFLISTTKIHHVNSEINGVWLPLKTKSESKICIGALAVMNIDYGEYQISFAPEMSNPAEQ